MIHLKSTVSLLLIYLFLIGPISQPSARSIPTPSAKDAGASTVKRGGSVPVDDAAPDTKGLRFRLSEGTEQSARPESLPVAATTRLSESETQNVLKRLPPIKAEATDEQDFALRDRSLPPPRTGKTATTIFPPNETRAPDSSTTANAGPLEVLRFSPEGDVPLAPQLSVTFSQPMVDVTSQGELAALDAPVRLTPQPKGRWRWVGTKTLLFEPEGRFAMATSYQVSIPAGTKSATGAALSKARAWSFNTPPPQVKMKYPESGPQRRDTLIFIAFDQRINPAAVLPTIKVSTGQTNLSVRLATAQEIERDEAVRKLVAAAESDRWIALKVNGPASDAVSQGLMPAAANISVTVGPNTPSAEGPRTTTKPQTFSFQTFGPLRVTRSQCGYEGSCSPFDTWSITFSNPLDAEAFQSSQVRIEPEVPGFKAAVYGNMLNIEGTKRGRTVYKVTLDKTIRDQFGQTLGTSASVTFNVGPAPPALASTGEGFITLDPSGPPRFSIFSINHNRLKVSLYRVGPEDWEAFAAYMRYAQGYNDDASQKRSLPGRQMFSKVIEVKSKPDEMVETDIDLKPALDGDTGQAIIVVEPLVQPKNRWEHRVIRAWVQATQIGLDAFVDRTDLVAWANSLKDGQPLEGVRMSLLPSGQAVTSGADGLARIELPSKQAESRNLLIARRGPDVAILPEHAEWWSTEGGWYRREATDSLRWYVFDDRKMYRPGEEVHIKGWIRRIGGGTEGDVGPLNGAATSVSYKLKDSRGNEVGKGSLQLNALGGFDTVLKLPGTMNLGYALMELEATGGNVASSERSFTHNFQVQEFRRPEFEVKAQASEGPHIIGGHADASVTAAYYAGGGLPNTEVVWNVTSTPTNYTPPNRDDYTFGKWIPWWISHDGNANESRTETFTGRTDGAGKHHLRIDFDAVNPPRPSNVKAEARVTDVNRQAWVAASNMLVHPSALYVGLRSDRTFVQQGEPLVVQSIVTDIDGKAIAGQPIRMRAVLLDWTFKNGEWKQEETSPQDCTVQSGQDAAVKCSFETKAGGTYRVTARVMDERERPNESELTLWVAGGKQPPKREVEQETVEMIPDRKEYKPGDTAELLVQAPFFPAEGVLTLRRSGLLRSERFRMDGPTTTIKVPIEERFIPNLHVQVDLVGAAARTDDAGKTNDRLPKRPAYASGELNLTIPPLQRRLMVEATPRDKALEPGAETMVNVEVRDAQNKAVAGSEVAVVVVDESVLALSGYKLEDPLSIFYAQRSADVSDHHSRAQVVLSDPATLEIREGGVGAGGAGGGPVALAEATMEAPPPPAKRARFEDRSYAMIVADSAQAAEPQAAIRMRENFNALAVFVASLPTDAGGRAQVRVKLPDNLTRYRVMAVSVADGKRFGTGESAITARQPLMVRPSAPRFLNFGDRFELPVVVQNQTDSPMTVDLAVRATNAELTDGAGRRTVVPANDRAEIRLPVAANRAGTARFQMAAVSGRFADAAEIGLPVWTPATTEAFATYGELDEGAIVQPVKTPADIFKQFGGLEITTSSTQLQELTDAVLYLVAYPYECSEQLSSRVLAVAALRDVLTAFSAKGLPKPEEMTAAVARDIKRLQGLQNADGGFGFWRRGEVSWPYVSIHVAHSLQRAQEKKFEVPNGMLEQSQVYLRNIEKHIPSDYPIDVRRALIAYALYVRNRMNDRDAARARRLITEAGLENLSLEAVGWLLPVLSGDAASRVQVEAIRRLLNNRVSETAGAAHFTTSYTDGEYLLLHSERRADGIILESLIGDQPTSDLIPKIVRGLLAHRKAGRWENTQENVFILLALDRYFGTYEKVTPDFVARAWLGERFAGEQEFKGRKTDRQQVNVPMRYLAETTQSQNLVLSKTGPGRLYYRVGMQYAPANLKLSAADYGFTVERVYEALDNASDVRRDAEGVWHIKAGSRVRVRLTLAAPARRYHVALVDPIPAGLEAINPALAVAESIPEDTRVTESKERAWWWWSRPWFEHQNLRDERAEAFTSLLWEGVYTYSYVARATVPGQFVVPPAKAEEMYHPETFGRGASDRVTIE